MQSFTVIISDAGDHDRGYRASSLYWGLASHIGAYAELGLYWFLCAYYGRRAVRLMRPSQLVRSSRQLKTDWLFVGLPTRLSHEHLRNIQFQRMALYDATDADGINFGYSDVNVLLSQTGTCLKNWRDDRWDFKYHVGLLPIKRPPLNNKLARELKRHAIHRLVRPTKRYDVGFVARPTGGDPSVNPRVQWLRQLKRDRPEISLWGGLIGDKQLRNTVCQQDPILQSCWLSERKINFATYFSGCLQSRVALTPPGYAPWTYRHYEAIYAHALLACEDISHCEFLVPIPDGAIFEVPKGSSVIPAIDTALEKIRREPAITIDHLRQLEQWWRMGHYSRGCPDLLARFWEQLG